MYAKAAAAELQSNTGAQANHHDKVSTCRFKEGELEHVYNGPSEMWPVI